MRPEKVHIGIRIYFSNLNLKNQALKKIYEIAGFAPICFKCLKWAIIAARVVLYSW
ncbi:hypothetical protein SAMN04488033_10840 [Salegentibacter agarivorans]|uniref:Uncharacterized protein n=1 Tax=Salegentibacter agarivorans TaxID=345907 RepID=A0A1I2LDB9_9FLAO|nr:hypothetical protein SAMN04488033_10840 [Salegentibacter agarivorans]